MVQLKTLDAAPTTLSLADTETPVLNITFKKDAEEVISLGVNNLSNTNLPNNASAVLLNQKEIGKLSCYANQRPKTGHIPQKSNFVN